MLLDSRRNKKIDHLTVFFFIYSKIFSNYHSLHLVPNDITVAQFMWIIRKRIDLAAEKAIFLFVDKIVPQSSWTMGELYNQYRHKDGFLYIAYSGESTFG